MGPDAGCGLCLQVSGVLAGLPGSGGDGFRFHRNGRIGRAAIPRSLAWRLEGFVGSERFQDRPLNGIRSRRRWVVVGVKSYRLSVYTRSDVDGRYFSKAWLAASMTFPRSIADSPGQFECCPDRCASRCPTKVIGTQVHSQPRRSWEMYARYVTPIRRIAGPV